MPHVFSYFDMKQQSQNGLSSSDSSAAIVSTSAQLEATSGGANAKKMVAFFGAAAVSNQQNGVGQAAIHDFYNKSKQSVDVLNVNNSSVSQYFSSIGEPFRDMDGEMYSNVIICCPYCNRGEMIEIEDDGYSVCNNSACNRCIRGVVCSEKSSFKDPPNEIYLYEYQRINHFKEIIAQFQGKETTKIPDQIIDRIERQIKKERIDKSTITISEMRSILKRINLSKRYDHAAYIMIQLGLVPPKMSTTLEQKLFSLFNDIQTSYERHCPDTRVNFLNYYYTAYKLCELLGERTYLPHFRMLQDPRKRDEQDEIWRKICKDKNWTFYYTVV